MIKLCPKSLISIFMKETQEIRGTWKKPHQTDKLPQLLRTEPSTDSSIELVNRVSLVNIMFSGF